MAARDHIVGSGDFAPGWAPDEGDEVEGRVVSIGTRDGQSGPYRIFTVEQANGSQVAVHAAPSVLRADTAEVRVGDELYVRFDGQRRSKNGRNYGAYTVGHEPAQAVKVGADDDI